jgi:hypothetical protein
MLKVTITVYTEELRRLAIIVALGASFALSCLVLVAQYH